MASSRVSEKSDFIVIGGGLLGLLSALTFKLNEPKARVQLLEQHLLGSGASTANGGTLHSGAAYALQDDPGMVDQCIRCRDSWSIFGSKFDVTSRSVYLVEPERSGSFDRALTAAGIAHAPASPEMLKSILRPEVQSARVPWLVQETQLNCRAVVDFLETCCQQVGVDIRTGSRVLGIEYDGRSVHISLADSRFETTKLAITAGAGTTELLGSIGNELTSHGFVNRHGTHVVASEPSDERR